MNSRLQQYTARNAKKRVILDSSQLQGRSSASRVTQTNMIYVVGLPKSVATQRILASQAYCGQYGKVLKAVIKESPGYRCENYCSYVTFLTEEAASLAILALTDFYMEGVKVSASYGTTKYCSTFLRHGQCRKVECLFHHKIEPQKEIHGNDNRKIFNDQQRLAREYIIKNYDQLDLDSDCKDVVFPPRAQIKQRLISQGIIRQQSRLSLRKNASEVSTHCSPQTTRDREESLLSQHIQKASLRKKSFFSFVPNNATTEYQKVSIHLQNYLDQTSF